MGGGAIASQNLSASPNSNPTRPNAYVPPVSVFKNPEFRRLWAIGAFGGMMRWLDTLVLALVALNMTGSPTLVSLVFFFRMAPMLFGIGLGIFADRVNRKLFLVIGLLIQALIASIMASERTHRAPRS